MTGNSLSRLGFADALKALKAGHSAFREDWDGGRIVVEENVIIHRTEHGALPWIPRQVDIMAEDWELV